MTHDKRLGLRIRPATLLWTEIGILASVGIAAYHVPALVDSLGGITSSDLYKSVVTSTVVFFHVTYLAMRKDWRPFSVRGYAFCTLAIALLLFVLLYLRQPAKSSMLSYGFVGDFQRIALAVGVSASQLAAQVIAQTKIPARKQDSGPSTPVST